MSTYRPPAFMMHNALESSYDGLGHPLPPNAFEWTGLNVASPGELRTADAVVEMARHAREMGFSAVIFTAKTVRAYLYYDTHIGDRAPGSGSLDHLRVAVDACHAEGLQIFAQFCVFREGAPTDPSTFIREHPEYANWSPGDRAEVSTHMNGVFACPDRPEVVEYELSLIREVCENYDIDGVGLDYVRYKNSNWCVCPFSEDAFDEYYRRHDDMPEEDARTMMATETIISVVEQARAMVQSVRPGLLIHAYAHPPWANKFPVDYISYRASSRGKQPGRGGEWPLQRVYQAARHNVYLASTGAAGMKAAPMLDTSYAPWDKTPQRFVQELRHVYDAGARGLMVFLYSTLRYRPQLRDAIARELLAEDGTEIARRPA